MYHSSTKLWSPLLSSRNQPTYHLFFFFLLLITFLICKWKLWIFCNWLWFYQINFINIQQKFQINICTKWFHVFPRVWISINIGGVASPIVVAKFSSANHWRCWSQFNYKWQKIKQKSLEGERQTHGGKSDKSVFNKDLKSMNVKLARELDLQEVIGDT